MGEYQYKLLVHQKFWKKKLLTNYKIDEVSSLFNIYEKNLVLKFKN